MAGRKTRTKLKFQAQKAYEDMDRACKHLSYLHGIANGKHPVVNEYVPILVTLFDEMQKVLIRFRANL